MLPRIGIVVLRSTTPCVRLSSRSRSNFFTLNSIAGFPPLKGTNKTTTAKGYFNLFYSRDKDRSSSRRCGNEEMSRIVQQGCVCPVHRRGCNLRIARINRRKSSRESQQHNNFPQALQALHRFSTALLADFQQGKETRFN